MKIIIVIIILSWQIMQGHGSVVVLRAILGRDAHLPCGQGKVFLDGPESFVHWLKNEKELLYRFPVEGSNQHDRAYTAPCVTGDCQDETTLVLKHVTRRDAGLYRCRVHYQASPSVDYLIELRLVASPGEPKIYKDKGELVNQGYIGPLSLGTSLNFTCIVEDGRRDTVVFWRRNGVPRTNTSSYRHGVQRAFLRLDDIDRSEQEAHYECVVQNSDVTEPLVAGFVIKMSLPPVFVEIRLNNNVDFEAGQPRVVDCVVLGCVPPPSISWLLGSTVLKSNVHKEFHNGNFTVSSLTLAPSLRDNKSKLTCKATNSHMPGVIFQDKVVLNVGFRPTCLTPQNIKVGVVAGEAETVSCIVDASPAPAQFTWIFSNSKTMYTSAKKMSGHSTRYSSSLVWVPSVEDVGELTCRANNMFGEQKQTCTYILVKGGEPETPACSAAVLEPSSLIVQCNKTWNGGRPQTFHLDLLDSDGKLLKNTTSDNGAFRLSHVPDKFNVTVVVHASSIRGASHSKSLYIPAMPTELSKRGFNLNDAYTVLFIVIFIVILVCLCMLKYISDRQDSREASRNNPDVVPPSDGVFHREPDFTREERVVGTTNITVNQMSTCQNEYAASSLTVPGGAVRCTEISLPKHNCSSGQQTYYV